jgi:His/Glu/Gln/Arg/opine family amino acid ABC transporter permease subunit
MPEVLKIDAMLRAIPRIISKAPLAFYILVISVLIGLGLGFLLALARLYKVRVLHKICAGYVTLMRGTPGIILLYIVYYAMPQILQALGYQIRSIPKISCVIVALGLNSSAFFSEIFRSAVENIDSGQSDAAYSIGMTRTQGLFRILLPQAKLKALPNISNIILVLFKETALGFYIGLLDIMGQAKILGVTQFLFFEMYLSAALVYWALCSALEFGFAFLEKRIRREVRSDARSYIPV